MSDDRAGEELARAWLQGKSELVDDLAALIDGMPRGELGPVERSFLRVVGEAARREPRGHTRQRPAGAPRPAVEAQPLPEAPPVPRIDIDEFRRRRQERERAARFEDLARRNAGLWGR